MKQYILIIIIINYNVNCQHSKYKRKQGIADVVTQGRIEKRIQCV